MNAALDLAATLVERGALLEGHFKLSSGRHSARFVQKFRILE
ncbi:MAG: orotate phosphoribosyltransferase, partial [Candidatus Eremiobacteraeota bacterium]|nr:orotate phosphoribosyltransferase [Candidatus Eremiobacteraeota bacterium]